MRPVVYLICLALVSACSSGDVVSERRPGQQHVCHKNKTLTVSTADMFVHQNHGDSLGPCPSEQ